MSSSGFRFLFVFVVAGLVYGAEGNSESRLVEDFARNPELEAEGEVGGRNMSGGRLLVWVGAEGGLASKLPGTWKGGEQVMMAEALSE